MKSKKPLIPFYAISGYYSTSGNDLGIAGFLNSAIRGAYNFISHDWIWILSALIIFLIIFFFLRHKKNPPISEDLSLPALILANNIEEL